MTLLYSGKLNQPLTFTYKGHKVDYSISELEGIPQEGDIQFKMKWSIADDNYTCETDGLETTITINGEVVEDDQSTDISSEIILDYASKIGMTVEQTYMWSNMEGDTRFQKGDLVE